MRALWLEDGGLRFRDDLPAPDPRRDEAVIRVLCAGICNTDLELTRGYYPFTGVPGHEFVGVVETGPAAWRGRRVVGEINTACGVCPACQAGHRRHCETRTVLGIAQRHGAFADYLTLPVANLHQVPDSMASDVAVFTEPIAAALEIQEQVPIHQEDRVVVIGDGKLGQLIGQTLALTGCELLVVGRHAVKLAHLSNRGIPTGFADVVQPRAFDIAIECTGNSGGIALARRALRPRGTLVLKSTYAGQTTLDLSTLVVDEITTVGSRCGPFAPALKLLAEQRIDPRPLITQRFPLPRGPEAFDCARVPGSLKVLIDVSPA